ncbi:MAG: TerC family protein, partial [Vicinamibacteria bacterium]
MDWISEPEAWIGFLTLTALEIVLGIDNIVFISILSGKLPAKQQKTARRV